LVTNGSGVPSMSTTAPAFNSGATICTDPSTSGPNALNTALLNVYNHAATPNLVNTEAYLAGTYFLSQLFTWQLIPNTIITLNTGRYLISYNANTRLIGVYTGGTDTALTLDTSIYQVGVGALTKTNATTCPHYTRLDDNFWVYGHGSSSTIIDVASTTSYQVAALITSFEPFSGSIENTVVSDVSINAVKIADLII